MNTTKFTLIFASLALVLAIAGNSYATDTTNPQPSSTWCGGQSGSPGPHGYGHGYGR